MKPTEQEITSAADMAVKTRWRKSLNEMPSFSSELEYASGFHEGFMEGANWAISQMQTEWVPVTERLPERDADVYFYRLSTSEYVYEGKYVGAGFFKQGNILYDQTVTHFIEKVKPQPPTK